MQSNSIWYPFTVVKQAPEPLPVKSAKGVEIELQNGKKIIDCISSWWVNLHGHCEENIVRAIKQQAEKLEQVIFTGFTHEPAEELTKLLLTKIPSNLEHLFFSDNGSTAVEVALKLSLQYWKNKGAFDKNKVLRFEGAYHGDTLGAMSVSGKTGFTAPFESHLFPTLELPFPFTFDGDPEVEEKENLCFLRLEEHLEQHKNQIASMILEPLVQGAGGMRMCRESFLKKLHQKLKKAGVLVIYDEVMTGFGRTGDWFACKKIQTEPDFICLSKGITGGFLPLAVTACTKKIYETFYDDDPAKSFFHGHSYTGNPIGCAAGIASFHLLNTAPEPFKKLEDWHNELIEKLKQNPKLTNFRVKGTIAAMEVVTKENTNYFNQVGPLLRQKFIEKGFLLRPLGNVIYILPPYCIRFDQLESTYSAIDQVVSEVTL